jgi:1-deoxy-D-xylulose-5-phosphate synthase
MRPVCAIYSTFLQRGYDQVFQEVILQRLPVVFAMDRGWPRRRGRRRRTTASTTSPYPALHAGHGADGTVKDGPELHEMMQFALATLPGPSGIRYARGNAPGAHELLGWHGKRQPLQLGKMEIVREGGDGAVLGVRAHGADRRWRRPALLDKQGVHIEVVNARFVKPLDEEG